MYRKNIKELKRQFPKLLSGFNSFPGDGWYYLIEEALQAAEEISEEFGVEVRVSQIKEKFGALVIDFEHEPNWDLFKKLDNAASSVRAMSRKVCELCGKEGSLDYNEFWMKTLCDDCKKLRKEKGPIWRIEADNEERENE